MAKGAVWRVLLAAVVVVGGSAAAAKKPYRILTSAEDFDKLLAQLTAQGEAYAQAPGDAAPPPAKAMAGVEYSLESVEHLQKAFKATGKDALADLYVAHQLLQPMHKAGDELLRKFQPVMDRLLARCRYKPMPQWPRAMLADLNPPKSLPKPAQQARMKRRGEALAKKRAAEQAVVKHNRMVNALEATLKELMVLTGDEKADQALLDQFDREVEQRWCTFEVTLSAVRKQAVRMKQAQAKRYYDRILQRAQRVRGQRDYADPTRPRYSDKDNSSFDTRRRYFAAEALKVVNLVATSAKAPAVIVPGEKPPVRKPRRTRDPRRR